MPDVSATYLDLASRPKGELAALFDAGTAPDVRAVTGFEFRGYNQPRAAALLGIRKFIKAFFPNGQGQPFGCNTPVRRNRLDADWIARPSPERPRRYAFFRVEPPDPEAADRSDAAPRCWTTGRAATPAMTSPGSCGTMWSGCDPARTTCCSARRTSSWPERGSPTPTS